jgi:hypothetical protein
MLLEGLIHGLKKPINGMEFLVPVFLEEGSTVLEGYLVEEGLDQAILLATRQLWDVLGVVLRANLINPEKALRVLDEGLIEGLEVGGAGNIV